jgi:hypothetical protein
MDTLQQQVNLLTAKVDALFQAIEQLGAKMSDVMVECKFGTEQIHRRETGVSVGYRAYQGYSTLDAAMEHKDVLVDHTSPDSMAHSGERQLSPEIQIQRLTAQLTAAYNRIAALEEQLLSQRIH